MYCGGHLAHAPCEHATTQHQQNSQRLRSIERKEQQQQQNKLEHIFLEHTIQLYTNSVLNVYNKHKHTTMRIRIEQCKRIEKTK